MNTFKNAFLALVKRVASDMLPRFGSRLTRPPSHAEESAAKDETTFDSDGWSVKGGEGPGWVVKSKETIDTKRWKINSVSLPEGLASYHQMAHSAWKPIALAELQIIFPPSVPADK